MSTPLTPAAQAIVQALAAPGIDDAQRAGLVAALQAVMAPDTAAAPIAAQQRPKRARKVAIERKAESIRFGKESVAALPLPANGERYVYDTECPQLAVRLRPGGKTFMVVMWDRTRRRAVKATLGKTEALTPENARKKAQAMVAAVSSGQDVRRPAVEGLTVVELVAKWHAEKVHSVRTADELRVKVTHYLGKLAYRRAAEVTPEDIGTIHTWIATQARKRIHKRVNGELQWVETGPAGRPATADKWRATLSAIFEWGLSKHLVASNPAAGIGAAFDAKGAQRSNYLRGDELLRFWRALQDDRDEDTRDALQLLLYTGQRRGNVLCMRWSGIDLEQGIWTVDAAETKQNEVQTTPLTAQAREILARRQQSAASQWVFPATRVLKGKTELGPMNETRIRDAWKRILTAAGITNLRIHDIRHTSGSWLARLNTDVAIRQKALGHKTPQMAAKYSHLELDPVADAMQRMNDAVVAAATKAPAALVKIAPAARRGAKR